MDGIRRALETGTSGANCQHAQHQRWQKRSFFCLFARSGLVDWMRITCSGDVVSSLTTGAQPLLRFNGSMPSTSELGAVRLGGG